MVVSGKPERPDCQKESPAQLINCGVLGAGATPLFEQGLGIPRRDCTAFRQVEGVNLNRQAQVFIRLRRLETGGQLSFNRQPSQLFARYWSVDLIPTICEEYIRSFEGDGSTSAVVGLEELRLQSPAPLDFYP